jgi:hypothetical protein
MYSAVHGGEDKKNLPPPENDATFVEEFDKIWNE